jgi:fumarate hydratase class II
MKTRVERDSMGEMTVPAHVLYGASTQRAVLNFPVSGRPVPPAVIHAFGLLKHACAESNNQLGKLPQKHTKLITKACDEIVKGLEGKPCKLGDSVDAVMEHFPIDIFQTGSGTSTNMNANEVISNLACMAAGAKVGAKDPIHPNDHVNMGQSSNDTFPPRCRWPRASRSRRVSFPR